MKKLIFMMSGALMCGAVAAQDGLPTDPEPGKCYAKCVAPDEYKQEVVKVMTKPAYKKLDIVPAEYKDESETVVIKPKSKKYTYVPAKYKTVNDTIWTLDGYNKLAVLPSEFKPDNETVEIKTKSGKWVAGEKDPDCPSIDPEDCRILHYREIPGVSKDIPVEKKVKDETTSADPVKGKFVVVSREVEVEPAKYIEEEIPEETRTVSKRVLVTDETTKPVDVPAEYLDVVKQVLVKQGGLTVWRPVPCTLPKRGKVLPINYELGSAKLTPSATKVIDENLLAYLQDEQGSVIEIGSHTDARGANASNQKLSESRAKSVVEYLISKGIDKDRLLGVGYGEAQPMNECRDGVKCSESKHAQNRRTEFKVF